ncbi:hypothetical protein ACS0TY_027551 [Phlomoides rotata]
MEEKGFLEDMNDSMSDCMEDQVRMTSKVCVRMKEIRLSPTSPLKNKMEISMYLRQHARTIAGKSQLFINSYDKALGADVFLLCNNAMVYYARDTIYYRQARSMLELAKRDFANLRYEGYNGELQLKVVRRGRPPSNKIQKKPLETSPIDRADSDVPETS